MPSPRQLANLERGRPYRWKKGQRSPNPRGSKGRLGQKVPGWGGCTYKEAIIALVALGKAEEVLALFRQACHPPAKRRATVPPEGWKPSRRRDPNEWPRGEAFGL